MLVGPNAGRKSSCLIHDSYMTDRLMLQFLHCQFPQLYACRSSDEATLIACRFRGVVYIAEPCQLHHWQSRIGAAGIRFNLGFWATEEKAAWAFDQAAIALGVSSALDSKSQLGGVGKNSAPLRAPHNFFDSPLGLRWATRMAAGWTHTELSRITRPG